MAGVAGIAGAAAGGAAGGTSSGDVLDASCAAHPQCAALKPRTSAEPTIRRIFLCLERIPFLGKMDEPFLLCFFGGCFFTRHLLLIFFFGGGYSKDIFSKFELL